MERGLSCGAWWTFLSSWAVSFSIAGVAPPVLVVCGPSGVGKTTVINLGLKGLEDKFTTPIMHTTRVRRPSETDSADYHFVTEEEFQTLEREGKFMLISPHNGAQYGMTFRAFQRAANTGKVIMIQHLSSAQAKAFKGRNVVPQAKYVLVVPPGDTVDDMLAVLKHRLTARGTENAESLRLRLASARAELEYASDASLWNKLVVNDDLQTAAGDFRHFFEQEASLASMHTSKYTLAKQIMSSGYPATFVVCGPSGVGKKIVTDLALEGLEERFTSPIMHTTRPQRSTETDGVDYFFVTDDTFKEMERNDSFMVVSSHNGAQYGMTFDSFNHAANTHKAVLIQHLSAAQAKSFKAGGAVPHAKYVFVVPPGSSLLDMVGVLRQRLAARGTETSESLQQRLDSDFAELRYVGDANLWDHIVVNDVLQTATSNLRQYFLSETSFALAQSLRDHSHLHVIGLLTLVGLGMSTTIAGVALLLTKKRRTNHFGLGDSEYVGF